MAAIAASVSQMQPQILQDLMDAEGGLTSIPSEFARLCNQRRIEIVCFNETRISNISRLVEGSSLPQEFIVTEESARMEGYECIPLYLDHFQLNKFDDPDDGNFILVAGAIQSMCNMSARGSMVVPRLYRDEALSNNAPQRLSEMFNRQGPMFRVPQAAASAVRGGEQPKRETSKARFLSSLDFPQSGARLSGIKIAYARTCEWILQEKTYQDWCNLDIRTENNRFLWIKGKPGTGKSTMMKFLLEKVPSRSAMVASFFFNARGDILEKSVLGMYRSLLHQLAERVDEKTSIELQDRFPHVNENAWTIEALQRALRLVFKGRTIVCLIDALDECDEDEVRELIEFLQEEGEAGLSSSDTDLRFCLSSRHYPHISLDKGLELVMENQPGHKEDITTYVKNKLKGNGSEMILNLQLKIIKAASGSFLWVVLVIEMLQKMYDRGQAHRMEEVFSRIPPKLEDLFADILTRDNENIPETVICLQWILFARRPLSLRELYLAITSRMRPQDLDAASSMDLEIVKNYILNTSKGLATIPENEQYTVQFIHETLRDFFLYRNGFSKIQEDLGGNLVGLTENELKLSCFAYFSLNWLDHALVKRQGFENGHLAYKVESVLPFLTYIIENMLRHAEAAEEGGVSQLTFLFQMNNDSAVLGKFSLLAGGSNLRGQWSQGASLLHLLAAWNLSSLLRAYIFSNDGSGPPDLNMAGERHGTALGVASWNGFNDIVRTLLEAGADPNMRGTITLSPLAGALSNGQASTARILLENGARLELRRSRSNGGIIDSYTILRRWARIANAEVLQILLENGVDVNGRSNRGGETILSCACRNNMLDAVQLLLHNGADPNLQGGELGNALQEAIAHFTNLELYKADLHEERQEKIVKLLLDHGADVNAQGGQFVNALQAAGSLPNLYHLHLKVMKLVQLLLEKGAIVTRSQEGGLYGNALVAAVAHDHYAAVKLLLKAGAPLRFRGQDLNIDAKRLKPPYFDLKEEVTRVLTQAGIWQGKLDWETGKGHMATYVGSSNS